MDIYTQFSDMFYGLTKVKLEMKFKDYCRDKGYRPYKRSAEDNSFTYAIATYGDDSTKSRCTVYNGKKNPVCNDTLIEIIYDESKSKGKIEFVHNGHVTLIMDRIDDGKILFTENKVVEMMNDHQELFEHLGFRRE